MSETKRILLVDDDPDYSDMVKSYLEKEGFAVDTAYDGKEGLEKFRGNPPDAVVLDVMMPEMDGFEVCRAIREEERYDDIPIVMLTAVASHVTSTRYSHYDGMEMDANDYLPKPASAEEITASVKRLLQ
ncbi:MAG: response regulator transcription factor [Desulfatibacillaceae bacterium]